jgi:hypothetical protein
MHAAREKSLEATFSMESMRRLYNDNEWLLFVLSRIISSRFLAMNNERPEDYRDYREYSYFYKPYKPLVNPIKYQTPSVIANT